jgi:hypothetical protein
LGLEMVPGPFPAPDTARGAGRSADVGSNPDVARVRDPRPGGAIARRLEGSGGSEPGVAPGLGSSPDMVGARVMGVGPVTNAEA